MSTIILDLITVSRRRPVRSQLKKFLRHVSAPGAMPAGIQETRGTS
ncbi:hypothetical protein [Actinoallomurus acanthiterrae]